MLLLTVSVEVDITSTSTTTSTKAYLVPRAWSSGSTAVVVATVVLVIVLVLLGVLVLLTASVVNSNTPPLKISGSVGFNNIFNSYINQHYYIASSQSQQQTHLSITTPTPPESTSTTKIPENTTSKPGPTTLLAKPPLNPLLQLLNPPKNQHPPKKYRPPNPQTSISMTTWWENMSGNYKKEYSPQKIHYSKSVEKSSSQDKSSDKKSSSQKTDDESVEEHQNSKVDECYDKEDCRFYKHYCKDKNLREEMREKCPLTCGHCKPDPASRQLGCGE
uniref:ShKT domain-containing protein n=1 Tax=Ditylenchus dipsaci TaxID=166011 RepID=A0A915EE54_9BILA